MEPLRRKDIDFLMSNFTVHCWYYSHNLDKCLRIMVSPDTRSREVNTMARRLIDTLAGNKQTRFVPREVLLESARYILSPDNPNLGKLTQRNKSHLMVILATG